MNAVSRWSRIALALLALGCSASPRTQVMLVVDGDPGVRAGATSVDVRIVGGGEVALERTYTGGELVWPREIAIVPRGNDAQRAIEVTITAELAQGGTIVRTARTGFVAGSTRVLYLRLESSCVATPCASGQTCIAGGCASDAIDPGSLPDYGRFDAGMATRDGGAREDGEVGCTANWECDDGVACTVDRCRSGRCEHAPDDARCTDEAHGTCDPVEDCQYPTCTPESCVANGCEMARCEAGACVRSPTCAAGELCCDGVCWAGSSCAELTPCRGRPAGTECRPSRGPCDVAEQCDGSASCPPDAMRPVCLDGVLASDEWSGAASTVNTVESTWSLNRLQRLMAQVVGGTLYIAVEGTVEVRNAMMVVLDATSGGVALESFCVPEYLTVDSTLSVGMRPPPGFTADHAWGNMRMGTSTTTATSSQGWRRLTSAGAVWLAGETVCSGTACEAAIPLSSLSGTLNPTIRLFARLGNNDLAGCGGQMMSNQTLPMDMPSTPWVVTTLMSLTR